MQAVCKATTLRLDKLHELQGDFFARYPEGFVGSEVPKAAKKYRIDGAVDFAQKAFAEVQFGKPEFILKSLTQLVSKSSMVFMFDKARFRDSVLSLAPKEREALVDAVFELLHGDEQVGFEGVLNQLVALKLGQWPLMSVVPFYFDPHKNWFIKPNMTKSILKYFEVDQQIIYQTRPSYAFYQEYRDFLTQLRDESDPRLGENNSAFTGFLAMTIK